MQTSLPAAGRSCGVPIPRSVADTGVALPSVPDWPVHPDLGRPYLDQKQRDSHSLDQSLALRSTTLGRVGHPPCLHGSKQPGGHSTCTCESHSLVPPVSGGGAGAQTETHEFSGPFTSVPRQPPCSQTCTSALHLFVRKHFLQRDHQDEMNALAFGEPGEQW